VAAIHSSTHSIAVAKKFEAGSVLRLLRPPTAPPNDDDSRRKFSDGVIRELFWKALDIGVPDLADATPEVPACSDPRLVWRAGNWPEGYNPGD